MAKTALVVGINIFFDVAAGPLGGAVNDARAISKLLIDNLDGSPNFNLLTPLYGADGIAEMQLPTRQRLRDSLTELFTRRDGDDDLLFYFAGHAGAGDWGLELRTTDGTLSADEIVTLANRSKARSVTIILDCCESGQAGDMTTWVDRGLTTLRSDVTILAASRGDQTSREKQFAGQVHGKFTQLLIEGLSGAAGGQWGEVTALSLYAYAAQLFGPNDKQQPVLKSYSTRLPVLRTVRPWTQSDDLSHLTAYFQTEASEHRLTQAYEIDPATGFTSRPADFAGPWTPEQSAFNCFKRLQAAHLIDMSADDAGRRDSLYWTAVNTARQDGAVWLTDLGRTHWRRVHDRLAGVQALPFWRPGETQPIHGGPGGHHDDGSRVDG